MPQKNAVLLTLTLACSALGLAAAVVAPQDTPRATDPDHTGAATGEAARRRQLEALHQERARLQSAVAAAEQAAATARQAAAAARERGGRLAAELDQALDHIVHQSHLMVSRRHGTSCRPARSLLTDYQWMQSRGHHDRAEQILAKVLERTGDSRDSLHRMALELLSDKACAGRFNDAALAVAERMLKRGGLRHQHFDTAALAMFLNGHPDRAVELQARAAELSDSGEYRRRLLVYRAASRLRPRAEAAGGGQ